MFLALLLSRYYMLANGQLLIVLLFRYLALFSVLQRAWYRCVTGRHRLRNCGGIVWCYTRRLVHSSGVSTNLNQQRNMKEIAIVGGGPAGALCGERLASAGFQVTIYDERLAWEKPCGGGLTHKAIEAYPFLLDAPQPKRIVRKAELISSRGHRARFEMSRPIVIYARKVLNGLLLDRAVAAGCTAVCSRVTHVDTGRRACSIDCARARNAFRILLCWRLARAINCCRKQRRSALPIWKSRSVISFPPKKTSSK